MGVLAEQQPVLVIVEDLHWVDPSTLELLARLIDQIPTTHIFLYSMPPRIQPPGASARTSHPSSSIV